MPGERLFWVRYEPRRWLIHLTGLSPAAELAHRRLADNVWATGQWPLASAATTAAACRVTPGRWPAVLRELSSIGWRRSRDRLKHPVVGRALAEARQALLRASACGQVGNAIRWKKKAVPRAASPATAPDHTSAMIAPRSHPDHTPSRTPIGG